MGLLNRRKLTAGLDVGSGFIKLVVIDHGGPEPEIARVAISPLVPDAIVDGEIRDAGQVMGAIRSVVERCGLRKKIVIASIGGHDVIIKRIQLDRMSEQQLREMIRWEAEPHVPFDMDSVQLDFQIMDADSDDAQMSVLLVAAKRDLVERRLELIAGAGLTPAAIDVDPFALHNAFERSYPDLIGGLIALVDIGHEKTSVNLIDDGVPSLVRDVPFGSRRLQEWLQNDRGIPADQANDVLLGRANGTELRALLEEKGDELALGIERAAASVVAHSGGRSLGRVYLCGGGACIAGLAEVVAQRLGIRTEIASPLERLGVHPEVMESVPLDQIAPMLMLAMGLALRH